MAWGNQAKFAGAELAPGAVIHNDVQSARNVQIHVRRLAAPRLGNRLHVGGPTPTRLENGPPEGGSAERNQVNLANSKLRVSSGLEKSPYSIDGSGLCFI